MILSAVSIPAIWPATIVKVTIVLGAAGVASLVLSRASAAFRHLIWLLALASCMVQRLPASPH